MQPGAQQTSAQTARAAQGNAALTAGAEKAVVTGAASAAVVVSMSSGKNSRAASHGEGRQADATFEREAKSGSKDEKDGKKSRTSIDRTA